MEKTSQAMVSRSLRLRRDTLEVLHAQAEIQGLGITVYIRRVLESLVDNLKAQDNPDSLVEVMVHHESRTV